ncbi:MAG: UdgX family uracil-DNA binding protein, partial [Janthinobacterium lividum]
PLVGRLYLLDKDVRRDVHKMRAFVRFREVEDPDGERFAAWFEPGQHIVRLNAGFFARRFTTMRWSILTPDECVHWDGEMLAFTPGATRTDAPGGDPLEETWRTYFSSIFNPARLKVKAMTSEMPKKYWRNLPEASLVPGLIAGAEERTRMMIAAGREVGMSNDDLLAGVEVEASSLDELRAAAAACTRCPLYLPATQTVFGEGPADARLLFVGEQPGDQEDLAGRPFVGPAGQMFDRALVAAGIDRRTTYVTNAVKHFKFEPRGKRRIHAKPDAGEIDACRWWVDHERGLIRPSVTVALGATAARSLTGKTVTISRERGRPLVLADGSEAWITVHPSFLLRIEDKAAAALEYDRFVADLILVRERVAALA